MKFDALKYVEELKEAGYPENQAQAQIRIWNHIVDSELATKRDIKELDIKIESVKSELKRDIKELDIKIESVKSELKRDIKELDIKIESVKSELKRDIKELEFKIKELESRLTIKLGVMLAAAVTLLAALMKF